jgi:putative hydrolase of the HAD superfamily
MLGFRGVWMGKLTMVTGSSARGSVRAVLLDADGVVQLPGAAWRASLESLCGVPTRLDDFLAELFAAERPCLTGAADFEVALAEVLNRWQSNVKLADALRVWTLIEPAKDVLATVGRLRSAGVVVALATNQQSHRAAFMTGALGYDGHFDHLLYSCELGYAKPNPEYFSAALAKLGMLPSDVLFIDDHEVNVAAARGAGLQAELFHLSDGLGSLQTIFARYGHRVF